MSTFESKKDADLENIGSHQSAGTRRAGFWSRLQGSSSLVNEVDLWNSVACVVWTVPMLCKWLKVASYALSFSPQEEFFLVFASVANDLSKIVKNVWSRVGYSALINLELYKSEFHSQRNFKKDVVSCTIIAFFDLTLHLALQIRETNNSSAITLATKITIMHCVTRNSLFSCE